MSPSKRPPQPIATASKRIPEQGRIRLGVQVPNKSGKGTHPESIQTLRFTSDDRNAIEAIAGLYGGQAKPWQNGRVSEWEVITTAKEVPILLPPDPLGGTPVYELWTKSLQRRCDGEEVVVPTRTEDGVDMVVRPCMCVAEGAMACDPKIRLSVILRDVPFGGTWRLETKGWNAFHELPGMVNIIEQLQSNGLVKAYLGVRPESQVIAGQTQDWVEPYLRLDESATQIAAGAAAMTSLGAASTGPAPAALGAGDPNDDDPCPCGKAHTRAEHGYDPDDEITDAEIIDDRGPGVMELVDIADKIDGPTKEVVEYLEQMRPEKLAQLDEGLDQGWTASWRNGQLFVSKGAS